MKIKDLKIKLINKSLDNSCLIFKWSDSPFLAFQYANEISRIKNIPIQYIDSLDNAKQVNSMFITNSLETLKILIEDKFKFNGEDLLDFTNTIIICKSTDKLEPLVESQVIEFPKPLDWQILDFMKSKCNLNDNIFKWLLSITKGDIFRINNELDKINIFQDKDQENIFNELNKEGCYSDLNSLTIFNLTNAILKKDFNTISEILKNIDFIDIEGTGLVTLMLRNFKNIADVKLNPKASPSNLNLSYKQFKAIEYNSNKFSENQIIDTLEFLTSIDYELKEGNLEMSNSKLVDYIICCLFSII